MPQIFNEEGRERVRVMLLESGYDLIKRYGLKKTSISDIAKAAGIATGTFYNFFKTKEEFIYEIVLYKRSQSKEVLSTLTKDGKMNKEAFKEYLTNLYNSDNNIFQYLNENEIAQLKARWPEDYWKNSNNDHTTIEHMLDILENHNPECDWKILGNMFKALALIGHGKDQLYPDKYEETIDIFTDSIVDYVFKK
ncbi:MAG: TetR/AcrR family transcriptional regulator [Eubacterium sp.]|nr:TetR/AcrR family transcriptional regulator [Eubacterium sp.]